MQGYRIGRLKGRFVVTWSEDGKRRRVRLDAKTAREADAEARRVYAATRALSGGGTVAQLWQAYRNHVDGRPVAQNLDWRASIILPVFGHLSPDQITVEDCRAHIARRRAEGRADGTIWTELGLLRNVLSWSVKQGLIDRAPYIERPSKPSPKDRHLTRAEVDKLLDAPAEPHVRLAILLMLTTAARVTAVLELTWSRVDLMRGQIDYRTPGATTRKGRAVVPINATLRSALMAARGAALSDHVVEWAGKPVASIKRGFARTVQEAGLRDVTPHTLRHTAAVHMAESGVPMAVIAQYLGHSDSRITESVYARFSPDHLRTAADVLEFGRVRPVQ
ncbi:site-specific integrase [Roseibacterium sp. SDUM158017]|uniref:tyrosine-type recombinase/integrase n=1 Tax=Roseicyclus salinarum TaxID=3036773 RepID=UPI0024150EA6|nr:site-specific integrase [Roseibacterium sp. SDUM158017]MDG4650079.1 site-specific integrase [Roseibacterium sp. SDUM158017]